MAKKTLLELVQNILNAMEDDEVNSIGDTVSALQVAEVIKETYEDITVGIEIPGRAGVILLDASVDVDRPTHMTLPADVEKLEWIRYNNKEIEYRDPRHFVESIKNRVNNDSVLFVDGLYILTDRDPQFYTSFDDNTLIFDAYDITEGSTLMQSKTLCWGQKSLNFILEDTFIPPLPVEMFPRLLSEAKAACFINFKQVANNMEERRARRQRVQNQNSRYKAGEVRPIDRLPNYGKRKR
jgi:hypothetical protein